jgi:hypothetical protein
MIGHAPPRPTHRYGKDTNILLVPYRDTQGDAQPPGA